MKPDKVSCLYCRKELDGKANKKFCSNAHRMAFVRVKSSNPHKTEHLPAQTEPEQQGSSIENPRGNTFDGNPNIPGDLTATDRTFYDRAMKDFGEPYYRFGEKQLEDKVCIYCGKKFRTTLSLLRYCSYNHYRGVG